MIIRTCWTPLFQQIKDETGRPSLSVDEIKAQCMVRYVVYLIRTFVCFNLLIHALEFDDKLTYESTYLLDL